MVCCPRGRGSRVRFFGAALVLYLLLLLLLGFGLVQARNWAVSRMSTPEARGNWQQFRDDVSKQADQKGPVRRAVPKSIEPPALVLMRDHFVTCTVIAIVLSSALYGTLMFFAAGALAGGSGEFAGRSRMRC